MIIMHAVCRVLMDSNAGSGGRDTAITAGIPGIPATLTGIPATLPGIFIVILCPIELHIIPCDQDLIQ